MWRGRLPRLLDPLELIAFCAWCFAVALAGGVAGLVFGNIRLPATLLVASHPAAGAGANIGISGVAATAAAIVHVRAGRINWRLFAWMAPPSMVGAVAGGYLSGVLPDTILLGVIGAVLLYFGVDLVREPIRPARKRARANGDPEPGEPGAAGGDPPAAADPPGEAKPPAADGLDIRAAVLTGLAVGLLGGLVGLILGALRMPALIRYVGETASRAVGTNLTVGVCVGVAGVIGHTPDGVDWNLLAIGSAASVPGALLGARLTGRLSEGQLLRAIGAMLVIAGVATLIQALV